MSANPLPGHDTGLPASKDRGPVLISDEELEDIAKALWSINDLIKAGKLIIGFAPPLRDLESTPAIEGLWGILGSIDRLAHVALKPIDRNL